MSADRGAFVSIASTAAEILPTDAAAPERLQERLGEIWDEEHARSPAGTLLSGDATFGSVAESAPEDEFAHVLQVLIEHPEWMDRLDELRAVVRERHGYRQVEDQNLEESAAEAQSRRIHQQAQARILGLEMLKPGRVAELLGAKASNREKVRLLRVGSRLLGIPRGRRHWVYPRFQIDERRACVYEEVEQVNRLLDAARDPWGVASWWAARNVLLDDRPCDVVGTKRRKDVWHAACAQVDHDPNEPLPDDPLPRAASAPEA